MARCPRRRGTAAALRRRVPWPAARPGRTARPATWRRNGRRRWRPSPAGPGRGRSGHRPAWPGRPGRAPIPRQPRTPIRRLDRRAQRAGPPRPAGRTSARAPARRRARRGRPACRPRQPRRPRRPPPCRAPVKPAARPARSAGAGSARLRSPCGPDRPMARRAPRPRLRARPGRRRTDAAGARATSGWVEAGGGAREGGTIESLRWPGGRNPRPTGSAPRRPRFRGSPAWPTLPQPP